MVLPERLDRSGRAGDLQVEEGYSLLSPQICFESVYMDGSASTVVEAQESEL